ncbi:MAG TPA: pectinesterase family protein [Opitutaceae bacterium]|nr:pectinesterase family protein [Opitutaceae bacterium]
MRVAVLPLALGTLAAGLAPRLAAAPTPAPFAVVAADGSGQYRTVQAAVNAAPQTTSAAAPWTIRIRPGVYREVVYVQREKHFVRLVGDSAANTVITYDLRASQPGPDGKPIGTFHTPTVWIDADDFSAENLTFANSAGRVGQALALRVDGDRVQFRHCRFTGWQDTILANRGRQYFQDCTITGAVDFIFGAATAYFDHCDIVCLGNGYITAASTPAGEPFGFVFAHCRVSAPDPSTRTYLGRPWRDFASVLFLDCELPAAIRPAGWHNWNKPARERTARFAEYGNTGPGAGRAGRVAWERALTAEQAAAISPRAVLGGWDPASSPDAGRPRTSG